MLDPQPKPEDYKFDPYIDSSRLEWEWLRQPEMMYEAAAAAAQASHKVAVLDNAMKVTKAEVASMVRRDPGMFDLGKVTEAAIDEIVMSSAEYKAAHAAWAEAVLDYDIWSAAVKALVDKKKALENITELHQSGYFASPKRQTVEGARRPVRNE